MPGAARYPFVEGFMNKKAYAVLIGVNASCEDPQIPTLAYAEKDCTDLRDVLTHPEIGNFPPENTTVLFGEKATTQGVKRALYRDVVGRTDAEIVLVYFSGHGIARHLEPQ